MKFPTVSSASVAFAMNDAPTTRVVELLLSTARSSRVWIPVALLVLGSIVFWSLLLRGSPTASYGSRVPLYASWAGFAAVITALGGVGWLRTCFPRRPIQVCRTCGYDMRGAPAFKSACPECGSSLRQTASLAVHGKMRTSVIALPGVLMLMGAVACAAYAMVLGLLLARGAFVY